jgi:hypothetical protein
MLGSGGEEVCKKRKRGVALLSKRCRVELREGRCFYALIARDGRGALLCLRSGPGGLRVEAGIAMWGRRLRPRGAVGALWESRGVHKVKLNSPGGEWWGPDRPEPGRPMGYEQLSATTVEWVWWRGTMYAVSKAPDLAVESVEKWRAKPCRTNWE